MHSALALSLSFLALTISAAPTPQAAQPSTVQVQFSNVVTGANGNAQIPLDGSAIVLGQAYADTDLEVDGTLFVTSLQFTANFQNVACEVLKDGTTEVASIADPHTDFQTFSEKPLNWQAGFTINCTSQGSASSTSTSQATPPSTAPPSTTQTGTVQVQFSNVVTGANGNAEIPLDGSAIVLGQAYADTDLEVGGTLFVTSLQFTANFQNVACKVLKDGTTEVASIADPHTDFQTFSEKPLNWQAGFTISCT